MVKERIIYVDRNTTKTVTKPGKTVYVNSDTTRRISSGGPPTSSPRSSSSDDGALYCFGFVLLFFLLAAIGYAFRDTWTGTIVMWVFGVWGAMGVVVGIMYLAGVEMDG